MIARQSRYTLTCTRFARPLDVRFWIAACPLSARNRHGHKEPTCVGPHASAHIELRSVGRGV
jgi:hypothetical protein